MFWLDNNTGLGTAPIAPPVISATKRFFTNGGPGIPPSVPEDFWFHMVQEELLGVLAMAGISPVKGDLNQVAKSIQSIAFSAYPVGAPIPWPTVVPPSGFLALNGQSFNPSTYPKLALSYPSGVLPDLRSKFIRGYDDGLGVDPGRTILSVQSSQNLSHYHVDIAAKGGSPGGTLASGTLYAKSFYAPSSDLMTAPTGNWSGYVAGLQTTSSGGNESRPININFYFIVRAA